MLGPGSNGDQPKPKEEQLMLILSRKVGESIIVGDDITVTVVGVNGNQVRIGVNAPRDVQVHREEIYDRIKSGEGATAPNSTLDTAQKGS